MKTSCVHSKKQIVLFTLALSVLCGIAFAVDLSTTKVQYVVAQSHLDTQWGWSIQETIEKFLPNTFNGNFELIEKYPDYVFNFEGAYRYMLIKQHYPQAYERIKQYVASGNWVVAGGFVDACDVNIPSPESLVRQILLGNGFFQKEFGKRSVDVFLPDCFGFGYALPTVAVHCGMKGFSTAKLGWSGAIVDLPFAIGRWAGVDGSELVSVLKPGFYDDQKWEIREDRINQLGQSAGVYADYDYFGLGDQGGALHPDSVGKLMARIAQNSSQEIKVLNTASDQIFKDLTPTQISKLPRYSGELISPVHGTGCYTSQSLMKWYNRKNEFAALGAECASVAAEHLSSLSYPKDRLDSSWIRFLWHQFHDDLTGTSNTAAYDFSTSDYQKSLADFSSISNNAIRAVSLKLDTRASGVPVVVFNPLAQVRQDPVTVNVRFSDGVPAAVKVIGPDGTECRSQILGTTGDSVNVLFIARVPSAGFAVFDIQKATAPSSNSALSVSESSLENERYRVTIDNNGDIGSILDKSNNKQLLSSPVRLDIFSAHTGHWPMWEILYTDIQGAPRTSVGGSAVKAIVERGPSRVALKITRSAEGSIFTQTISLSSGNEGNIVRVDNVVDWKTQNSLLKASFPLSVSNDTAVYDLGLGTIGRPNNSSRRYEVPAQQWADITNPDKSYGVSIMNDSRYGWDKPASNKLRLTLIHTPERVWTQRDYSVHTFSFAIAGHTGDWRSGNTIQAASAYNQELTALQVTAHTGSLGKTFSLLKVYSNQVAVMAVKKAQNRNEYVVRVRELWGRPVDTVSVSSDAAITSGKELNGQEDEVGTVTVTNGALSFGLKPYQPRTFSLSLGDLQSTGSYLNKQVTVTRQMFTVQVAGKMVHFATRAGEIPVEFSVYSMDGRCLRREKISVSNDAHYSSIKNIPSGTYVTKLVTDKNAYTVKNSMCP